MILDVSKTSLRISKKAVSIITLFKNHASFFIVFVLSIAYIVLFLALFNYLFDEKVDLKLTASDILTTKLQNWNRINAVICFNFLQQQFILIASTMNALATGKKGAACKAVSCLLECTRGTQYELTLDDECLKDIGEVLTAEYPRADSEISESEMSQRDP